MPMIPLQPDDGPAVTGTPTVSVDGGWAQAITTALDHNQVLVYGALILTVLTLWLLARKARKVARSEKPDDTLSTIGMLIGLGWSGEAMWIICTQILHVPIALTVLLLFVLEVNLSVAMIRAKRHFRLHGHPGRYGTTAWIIAISMALIAACASHSLAEVALRISIPLLVTKTWWDGMVGSTEARKLAGASTVRWTPRRLALWLGAIEPGERDVETVHRDRLTQQMTQLEFRRRYGRERAKERCARRLARLSLAADDAIISEVRQRVSRASWFTVTPITPIGADAGSTDTSGADLGAVVKRRVTASLSGVQTPPKRRVKAATQGATSGDARDVDPATQAAQMFLTGQIDSIRAAAKQVPGASEATVRRRVNEARDAASDAPDDAALERAIAPDMTQIPDPLSPVTSGVNGYSHTTQED